MAKRIARVDVELGPLTDDLLTVDVSVWQREKGHRFSSDDVVTAFVAWQTEPEPASLLDLGCGLGSVLLHLVWKMPAVRAVGVEAQDQSFKLLRENVARSAFAKRITIHHGDLREPSVVRALGLGFDLVTGTPPYFPPGRAIDSVDEQRTQARMEIRGGVEAYIETAARVVHPAGVIVLCGDSEADERVLRAAAARGTPVVARRDVIPRAGRPVLFSVWTLRPAAMGVATEPVTSSMTLRDADGAPSRDAAALRAFSGFDPAKIAGGARL
jgi:tRNA1Val (adenine37-N6)-methyltransferase